MPLTRQTPLNNHQTDSAALIDACRRRFESAFERLLPAQDAEPQRLHAAMRYSALSGGKRIRPMLLHATGQALQLDSRLLDPVACAIELIHAYSLIHDDLPAMDDDDMRRGRKTCHLAFDEATAILAGDALQALAFEAIAGATALTEKIRADLGLRLARACGSMGMAGGQMLDMSVTGQTPTLAQLEHIHSLKTGALIRLSVMAAPIIAEAPPETLEALDRFGECVGLGFQICDDILDVTGDSDKMGKSAHADALLDKATFPSLVGLEASRNRARQLRDEALACLENVPGDTAALAWLADYMIHRDR